MGIGQKFFKSKKSAQDSRRKGEKVVPYRGGFQLRKVKKTSSGSSGLYG